MKAIVINNHMYCTYPQGINTIEQFIEYLDNHYHSFIKLTRFTEEGCRAPYFIENNLDTMYLNVSMIHHVHEETITVLNKEEYDKRLNEVVTRKCVNCANYSEVGCEDSLDGYRENINLDGECWNFAKKSE
jgi:hypothetical protein